MPNPAVGVVAASALVSAKSAKDASKVASGASAAELRFAEEQQARFEEIYGPVEDNLASYYNQLTPDYYAVQGLEAFQQEQDQALTKVRETLAQRGLADSGVAAATEIAFGQSEAQNRARIISEAPEKVAAKKLDFLSVGKGNAPTGVQDALSGQAADAAKSAQQASAAAGAAVSAAANRIATGLSPSQPTPIGGA